MASASDNPDERDFLIPWSEAEAIVVFTGAGMSAESGVPTYRGSGGIWHEYRWQDYACQEAFDRDPAAVLDFHAHRRDSVLACTLHAGHLALAGLEKFHPDVVLITQNIDGMHQRAGNKRVIELHGSLWRVICPTHGLRNDLERAEFAHTRCPECGAWLRPDITWFGDSLKKDILDAAVKAVEKCDLFVAVGTSGVVWPAAGLPALARDSGAMMVEINPEKTPMSELYHHCLRRKASEALGSSLFPGLQ